MSAEMLWRLIADHGSDPTELARRVAEAFAETPADEIAIAFDVTLRAGALDRDSASILLTNLSKLQPATAASDIIELEGTTQRLRTELAEAPKRHGIENVAAVSDVKGRLDGLRRDLSTVESEIKTLKSRLDAVRGVASQVRA